MKKAIVLGGTTGIGAGVTQYLLADNYKVIVTGIEKEIIESVNSNDNSNYTAEYLDCINESPSELIKKLFKEYNGIDLVIFSAGIGNLNKDIGYTVENVANKLNVLAFTEIIDATIRLFEAQGYGHFVGVSSFSGLFGSRVAPAYHAAKAYQVSYMEGYRQRARKSKLPIYITDIRPGFVKTPMTEGKKMIWSATVEVATKKMYSHIKRKRMVGYITGRWIIAAGIIKLMPRKIRTYF